MKAAYAQNGEIFTGEMPDPVPAQGQALVRTHRCGLCASDAHFLKGGQNVIDLSRKLGGPYAQLDFSRPFVPGHEYVGEVIDYGPGSKRTVKTGRKVTSIPAMFSEDGLEVIGYSHNCPGGFGELMLLDENMLLEVPDEFDDDHAACIEPLAVGLEHARLGRPDKADVPLVIGCGAIGLGVIAGLKLMGIGPIIATDFSPRRRELALAMGADVALDPRETDPYAPLSDAGGRQVNLIYENVGLPGMLEQIIQSAPMDARIVMGGYCMEEEKLFTFTAQNKRLNVQFACGEEPQDMELALHAIGDGRIDVTPWLGETIGIGGVAQAIAAMSDPASPIRTVVDPRLD